MAALNILGRFEKREISDEELRKHIRSIWAKRLQWGYRSTHEEQLKSNLDFIKCLEKMDMGGDIGTLNYDAYELPTEFLELNFGKSIKQSTCYFKEESKTLDEAIDDSHELYCERAQIKDGQTVLDIGCGFGSLVLYIAQKYKNCHVTGLANLKGHVEYIELQIKKLKLTNVDVILADVTKHEFETEKTFDRIVVIQTIEPMDENDWYSGYIFPKDCVTIFSSSSLLYFQKDVSVVDQWVLNGKHTARSVQEWLRLLDDNMEKGKGILEPSRGGNKEAVNQVITRLRVFYIGAYEEYSLNNGEEWMVAQLLFKKK